MEPNPYSPSSSSIYGSAIGQQGGFPQNVVLSQAIIGQLLRTRPWVRFISVLIFIGAGFMLLAGGMMLLMGGFGMASSVGSNSSPFGALGGGMMMGMSLFYLLIAALYIYPGLKLWKYADRITGFAATGVEMDLEKALNEQRAFWKFVGLSIIIVMGLYILGILLVFMTIGASAARFGGMH